MPATLTKLSVEGAKPDPAKRREIPDGALPGFYLVLQPSGGKSWAVRYRVDGRPKKLTIGPYPRFGLGEARELARQALQEVSEGKDPAATKAAAKEEELASTTYRFSKVAEDFIEKYAKRRNRTWKETERLLTKQDLEDWQSKDIRKIGRKDVLDIIDKVTDRGATMMANRLFAALRRFFGWAVERGIIEASPMAGLKPPSPEVSRDRVLSDQELRAIWKAAGELGYPFGPAVQLLILTGQRRAEVLEAEWKEFDLDAGTWTIPRERSKNDKAHLIHLSDKAVEILKDLPRITASTRAKRQPTRSLLFTTNGVTAFSGISKAFARLNEAAVEHMPDGKPIPPWRLHDLRRTFASGCARLGIPVHVVEKALNHTSGTFGGIVGVYQRHDFSTERRDAMRAWAGHVISLTKAKPRNVVVLREAGNVG